MFIPLPILILAALVADAAAAFVVGLYVGKRNPKVLAQLPTKVP